MPHVETPDLLLAQFPESTASAPGMRVIDGSAPHSHGVVWLDVPYARESGRDLRLQIVWPPMPDWDGLRMYPAVVFVQGSGWDEQQLGQWLSPLIDFAVRGYVVAIVEYRPSEVAPFPAQIADARTAVRYLRAHAAQHKIDPNRMALWGDSSGAHTALMVHLADDLGLAACVDYYGPTDLIRMNDEPSAFDHLAADGNEGRLLGGVDLRARPDRAEPANVVARVPSDRAVPPVLIMHGSKDRVVPFAQSVYLYEALVAAGQPVEFYQLQGADHGSGAFWTSDTLDIVDRFLSDAFERAAQP